MTLADLASTENGRVHRPRQVSATERRGKRAGAASPRRKLGATEVHIFVTQRLCVIFPCCSDARRARARSMAQDDCASCLSRLPPGRLLRAFSALGRLPAPLSHMRRSRVAARATERRARVGSVCWVPPPRLSALLATAEPHSARNLARRRLVARSWSTRIRKKARVRGTCMSKCAQGAQAVSTKEER